MNRTEKFASALLAVILLSSPTLSYGQTKSFWEGAVINVGAGLKSIELRVWDENTYERGTLVTVSPSFFIDLMSPPKFFGKSTYGYNFMMSFSTFEVDEQDVLGEEDYVDLGTSAQGFMYYFIPTLFVATRNPESDWFGKFGLGAGIGFAEFDGDIILTDGFSEGGRKVKISHGSGSPAFALSALTEARWKNLTFSFSMAGPVFKSGGYEYQVLEFFARFGYVFRF